MNVTNDPSHLESEERSSQLRAELKQWERDFAASHNGRKPDCKDIKQDPDIASKYKSYDRLRKTLSRPAKVNRKAAPPASSEKRLHTFHDGPAKDSLMQTPSKRAKQAHPLYSQPVVAFASCPLHPALLGPYDQPISTLLSPSKARTSLGPTPQKDGKILGLFDILSSGSIDCTPSKRKILDPVTDNGQRATITPSKRPADSCEVQKLPGSASKGHGLSTIFTPLSHRVNKAKANSTPVSAKDIKRLKFDETPEFLRRDSQRTVTAGASAAPLGNEDGDGEAMACSPTVPQRTSKLHLHSAAGQGLSALVRGLREMEEVRFDEDLDLLREVEGGSAFDSFASKMSGQTETVQAQGVSVGESQEVEMPLGSDGAIVSEDEIVNGGNKTRDGRPLKIWKKKGQKRTTRAVKLRPSTAKWKAEPVWRGEAESEDDEESRKVAIAETQAAEKALGGGKGGETAITSSVEEGEYAADPEADGDTAKCGMATRNVARKQQMKDKKQAKEDVKKKSMIQKVKKKISVTAHANFRALKIRNKQSKAKGGNGRRFKRRR